MIDQAPGLAMLRQAPVLTGRSWHSRGAILRRLILLSGFGLLSGCNFFQGVQTGLSQAAQAPKIAFAEAGRPPTGPVVVLAALQANDTAFVTRRITRFGTDGWIDGLHLSPDDRHLAVNHVESGTVVEARVFMFDAATGTQVDFQTDNTLSDEITALCGAGPLVQPFIDAIPAEIDAGNLPRDTDGAILSYVDAPENEIRFQRWLDDRQILLDGLIEMALTYTTLTGGIDAGTIGNSTIHMTYELDGGAWQLKNCEITPPAAPVIRTTQDLTIGDAPDNALLLNGAVLNTIGNAAIAPDGVTHVSGPFTVSTANP